MECADRFAGKGFSAGNSGVTAMPAIQVPASELETGVEANEDGDVGSVAGPTGGRHELGQNLELAPSKH